MSWWTLGPEEEEETAPVNTRPNRGDRGRGAGRGRGYTPYAGRGRGAGRTGANARARPAPKLSDIPRQSEASASGQPESIFSALGRTVNQYLGVDNDDNTTKNTTGSAKYTNAPVRASKNANEAERRSNEMADAMAWLSSPEAAAKAAAEAGAKTGSDNWWENEEGSAGIADDVSIFSNASDFKTTDNVPDLMTMLRQKQDENARERERREESENDRKRKLGKLRGSTRNARQQAKKMGEAVSWWKDTLSTDGSKTEVVMDPLHEMKLVTEWWEANKDYVPVTDKAFNKKKKKAMKIRKALGHVFLDEMEEEKKARELKEALNWWQSQKPTYIDDMRDFEYNQSTFKKINDLFGQWELQGLPKQDWETFDPLGNVKEAERRAKDIQACVSMILNGDFDHTNPHWSSSAVNRIKDLIVDSKFQDDNSASDVEEALRWWRLNASSFDPLFATKEDDIMFRKTKNLLSSFGLKEGDKFNSRNKEVKEALKLWSRHKDTPMDQLEPDVAKTMKKMKHALLQMRRDSLDGDEIKRSAQHIDDVMTWYRSSGIRVTDVETASVGDAEKFRKAQDLLSLWGRKIDPSAEQLKEIADSLIQFRRNHYKPEMFDEFEGEEGDKFKKLEHAILNWRATGAENSEILAQGEAESIAKDIESALDWWRTNSEAEEIPEFSRPSDVYLLEKVKMLVEKWNPADSETVMTWKRTAKQSKEIEEAINLWRDHGKTFDLESLKLKPTQRELLMKLKDMMYEWRRTNVSSISEASAEHTVKEMINAMNWWKKKGKDYDATEESLNTTPAVMRHKMVTDTLSDWYRDMKPTKQEFKHLSAKEMKQAGKDLHEDMIWWDREGKKLNVEKDLEDADKFDKAKQLAQLWSKASMPRDQKDQVVEEILSLFKWMRKKNKSFNLDSVQNKKVDDIRKVFNIWGGKKNRKAKTIAREIEDALDWWRKNDYELDEDASPAEEEKMRRLDTLAQHWNSTAHPDSVPGSGANLDWFRNQEVDEIVDSLDYYETSEFNTNPRSKFTGPLTEEQKRANEMASALDWLRNNNTELDVDDDVSVALSIATFKKIDSLMPKDDNSSGVASMENALAWLRSKTDVDDETVDSFKKIDDVMVKSGVMNTIEESGFGGALDWLRKRQAVKAADGSVASGEKFKALGSEPMTEEQKRAAEMADQLAWLRSNNAADDISDDMSLSIGSVASFKNIDARSTGSGGGALPSALDWLRQQDNKSVRDSDDDEHFNYPSFTDNQFRSAEQKRADDMIKALDWLRDGVQQAPDDDDFKSVSSSGSGSFSPLKIDGSGTSEVDGALNWLREKNPESLVEINDGNKFSLLNATTGPRSKTDEQLKAQQMSDALDWLRTSGIDYEDELPNYSDILDKYGSIDAGARDGINVADDMASKLQWIRDTNPNYVDTTDDLSPHAGSQPRTQEQEKADAMADALAWLRNTSSSGEDEDNTNFNFEKYDIDDFVVKSQEERNLDRQNALNWLRNPGSDENMVEKFKKFDLILPQKEGQSSEQRASEMEDALNWLRFKGVDLDDAIADINSFEKLGTVPIGLRSMYENDRDFRNAMQWIRNSGDDVENGSTFTKLDSVLPARKGKSEKERARDMVRALAWCRENGVDLNSDIDATAFETMNFESIFPKSSADRQKDDFNGALNWLRNGSADDSLDPSGMFQKLEASLPVKEGQPLKERAQDIANALGWMRNKGLVTESETIVPELSKMQDAAFLPQRSPEQRAKDLSGALDWLRNKNRSEADNLDPTGDFRKLDSILPHKRGQSVESRAKDIEAALDWVRGNQVAKSGDVDDVQGFNRFPLSGVSKRTPEERLEDLNNALTWIRKGKGKSKKYDPTGEFRKLDKLLPRKRGQTPEERAREIEGALDFLRSNGTSPDDDDIIDKYGDLGSIPVSSRTPEQRHKDLQDALTWIRNKGVNDDVTDPDGSFRKLDAVLPMRVGQKNKARARQIEQFLDWTRESVDAYDDEKIPDFDKIESINAKYRSPEERSEEIEKIMNWLRRKGKKDKKYDPTGEFRKIDMLLPKKKNQSLEDRARSIEGVLDYVRNTGVSLVDDDVVEKLSKLDFLPVSRQTPEQRSKNQQDALNWLRNKGKNDDLNDPTGEFAKLDSLLEHKPGQSRDERARDIEVASDWLRNRAGDVADSLLDLDDGFTGSSGKRSREQRSMDLANVVNWLRNKGVEDYKHDPSGEFRRLDAMLPKKRGQTPEDRAREIEGALDWLREKDASLGVDDHDSNFVMVPSIPVSKRTIEQRSAELEKVTNWLRNKGKDDDVADPTGVFRKMDAMLPSKQYQTPLDRAGEIERAIDWCRNRNDGLSFLESGGVPDFTKVDSIPMSKRTPEERSKEVSDILNWLRGGNVASGPDEIDAFNKLNSLLPERAGQSLEERARAMEGVYDYIRNHNLSIDDETLPALSKIGILPFSRRTPEERSKDVSDALYWLRQNKDSTLDPSGNFEKVDSLLPSKVGQSLKDRARDIESVMDWCRAVGLKPSDNDFVSEFDKTKSVPVTVKSPQEREKELEKIFNFLRNKSGSLASPSNKYSRLDHMLPKNKNQSPKERARDIERTLDWIRMSGLEVDEEELLIPTLDKLSSVPVNVRRSKERKRDLENILNWIREGKNPSEDPTGEFRKIDLILPDVKGEKPRDRAQKIERAIDWVRNRGVLPLGDPDDDQFQKASHIQIATRTPEERSKDLFDVITWLRGGKNDEDDPDSVFRKVDLLVPEKPGQSLRERAREIENALDYYRVPSNSAYYEDESIPDLTKLSSVPLSTRNPEDRLKDIETVVNWIRSGKPDDDSVGVNIKMIDQMLPVKKGQSPEARAREIEGTLDWMRSNNVLSAFEEQPDKFDKLGSVPITRRSPEDRLKDREDILNWLRQSKSPSADTLSGVFKKIDQMLPVKKGQSPESRARDIESALDWMRSNNVLTTYEEQPDKFDKLGSVPVTRRSPEDKLDDVVADALNWLRSGKDDALDPDDTFSRIDQLLPKKQGRSRQDRAREIGHALSWIRNSDVSPFDNDNDDLDSSNVPFLSSRRGTKEEKPTSLDEVLLWMRNGKDAIDDTPDGKFQLIDELLPFKRGQTPLERARHIDNALLWTRNHSLTDEPTDSDDEKMKIVRVIQMVRKSPEDRQREILNITNWIRNGKPENNQELQSFKKFDKLLPLKEGQLPSDRASDIEAMMDWCRTTGIEPMTNLDDEARLPSLPFPKRNSREREEDVNNIIQWIRDGKPIDEPGSATSDFQRVDQMLPPKKKQSPDDRAKDIEGVLNWMRTNDISPDSPVDYSPSQFNKVPIAPVCVRSPEDRQKDVDNITQWVRNGKSEGEPGSATSEFHKIDQMLPPKKKQSPEDRAKDIESVLNWMRSNGVSPLMDVEDAPGRFDKLNSLPINRRSPEDRERDVEAITDWIRQGKPSEPEGPTSEFQKVDQILPPKKKQSPEERAKDVEGVLNWMRTNNVSPVAPEEYKPSEFKKTPIVPVMVRSPEDRERDVDHIAQWIRNGKPVGEPDSPTSEFQKVDQILPPKKKQSPEDRARDVESVLNWMRSNNVSPLMDVDDVPGRFDKLNSLPINRRSPEDRERDVDAITDWIRQGKPSEADSPTSEFQRVDQILPPKQKQSPEDRARDVESVLNWIRTNNITPTMEDENPPGGFDKLASIPVNIRSPEDRQRDSENILNWIRQGKPSKLDSPTGEFKKIDQMLPFKKNQSPEDRAKDVEGVLNWMRMNNTNPVTNVDNPPGAFEKLSLLPMSKRTPAERQKELDDIMHWIRNGKVDTDISNPDGGFTKIDQILPVNKSQSPDDRAREIEGFLDWCRNNNMKPFVDERSETPEKIGFLPCSRTSPEQRKEEYDDILDWLREGKPDTLDQTGEFTRIDQSLPFQKGQTAEDRANEIERALDWRRNASPVDSEDYEPAPFTQLPSIPVNKRSPEDRIEDRDAIISWIRQGKDDLDDETGEFTIIDQLLPQRPSQQPEERAREIENALDWVRDNRIDLRPFEDYDEPMERPGALNSIPRDRMQPEHESPVELGWRREPDQKVPPVPSETEPFTPVTSDLVPRSREPVEPEPEHDLDWARSVFSPSREPSDEIPFNRPDTLNSIPRGRQPDETQPEGGSMDWKRSPYIPGVPSEDHIYDRPADVRSIPRDGKPKNQENPEMIWMRTPNSDVPGVPDEEAIYDRPGDIKSVPRDGKPQNPENPEMIWMRTPSEPVPGVPDEEAIYDRPGDVKSIPRDGKPRNPDSPEYGWKREEKGPEIAAFSQPPSYDWSAEATPFNRPVVTTPFETDDDFELKPEENAPFYDWSGGRPSNLRSEPSPDMNWSADKPDNAWYKKDEPQYDWSGARPEGPFDRPSVTTATESDNDLELAAIPDDDVSEYEEEDDNKENPVTGVPLAAWSMLALGAVAGAGAAVGPTQTVPSPSPNGPQFALENPNAPTPTDTFFPPPESLVPCTTDPSCQLVSKSLGPYIPPGTAELFDIPGTCQTKARDWLRTGEDVLEFTGERIRQRYAMTVFFCEQDGGEWLENDMWLSDLHECDWYNMIGLDPCNRVEQMEMIRIHGNGLQGTLPSELSILSTIYEFTAADNLITGTFPPDYTSLVELDTLVLAFNQFSGEIPGYFFRYPDMVYWDVGFNKFSGTIPDDIPEKMPGLQVMFGENNQFSGTLPDNLGSLDLKNVHLDDNDFVGTIPSTFGTPPNLEQLFLHGNKFTGTIPETLANPEKLVDVRLHYNNLKGEVANSICENMYQGKLQIFSVDCEHVTCECCICGAPGV